MFALVDCNNFYASCERLFRPNLRHKPIVVLSNNDGCVIARSNEAKALGVPMGAPAFKFKELFKNNNIHVFSSNYALYGDMSSRVMSILSIYTPDIEVYSIDEAFLRFDGFDRYDLKEYGQLINKTVTKSTGIPISVGIAPTKSLSKVATRIAKKFPETTKGVHIIDSEEKKIKALKWLQVADVWGIGARHTRRLNSHGVYTAYDFTQLSDEWVRKNLAVVGLRLKRDLSGIPTLNLDEIKRKKAIATTRTFERNHADLFNIQERVSTFAVTCSEKLRKQNSCCNSIMVFLHTNGYRKDLPQYSRNIIIKTDYPTNSSIDIVKLAVKGLKAIYKEGYQYKKAGVIVMDITPENEKQLNMFIQENPKHKILMDIMDKLNNGIGQKKLKLGCQDMDRTWKMNQEKLSPRYTTRLDEIINVYT
tara:strand:- start:5394 stop:6653 length:1260 start_codon:yes stop_codon:yes gene_type:complete